MGKGKQIIVESILPGDLVEELFQEIKNFLEKEYKPLVLFREVKERVVEDGGKPWGIHAKSDEKYDLNIRVQDKLHEGRIIILRRLRLVKSFFDQETLKEVFDEERHIKHVARLFEIVFKFFLENRTVAIMELEESLDSLSWYVARIKEKLSSEDVKQKATD
jgi:hypothetical protein